MKLVRFEKKTPLDKYIYANLKMVENEIAISCCTSVGILISLTYILFWIAIPLEMIIGMLFLFKGAKKLFYTSVYGETSVFYNSFPVDSKTLVIGKITAAFIGAFLYYIITIVAFIPFMSVLSLIFDNIDLPELDMSDMITLASALSLEFLSLMSVTLAAICVIFLAVTLYNKTKVLNVGNFRNVAYIFLTFTIVATVLNITGILEKVGVEYELWMPAVQILVAVVVTFFAVKKIIGIFDGSFRGKNDEKQI